MPFVANFGLACTDIHLPHALFDSGLGIHRNHICNACIFQPPWSLFLGLLTNFNRFVCFNLLTIFVRQGYIRKHVMISTLLISKCLVQKISIFLHSIFDQQLLFTAFYWSYNCEYVLQKCGGGDGWSVFLVCTCKFILSFCHLNVSSGSALFFFTHSFLPWMTFKPICWLINFTFFLLIIL